MILYWKEEIRRRFVSRFFGLVMVLLPIEAIDNAWYGTLWPLTDLTHIFHLCSRGRTCRHVVAIICYIPRTRTVAASYRDCSVDNHEGRLVFCVTDFMFIWTCVIATELYETGAHAMICRSNTCQTLAELSSWMIACSFSVTWMLGEHSIRQQGGPPL